jgi:nicotinamidase-related amidase
MIASVVPGRPGQPVGHSKSRARKKDSAVSKLTRGNSAVVLIDHQVGLLTGVRDMTIKDLEHNVVHLAKAAKALSVPLVVTNAATDFWGPTIPALVEVLNGDEILTRTIINSWDDPRFVRKVEATGRKNLIIAGVSLPVCAALPAMSAIEAGYGSYLVVDASASFTNAGRDAAMFRVTQAGVRLVDYASVMCELLSDNADPLAPSVYDAIDMPFVALMQQLAEDWRAQ